MILFLLHTAAEQYLLLAATLEYTRIHLSNEFPVRLTNNSSYYTDNEGGNTAALHFRITINYLRRVTLKSIELFPFLIVNYLLCVVRTSKEPHFGAWAELAAYVDYSRPLVHDDAGS